MKLTRKKLIELLRVMEEGGTVYCAKKKTGVSVERVYQIWNEYKRTEKIPELGKNILGTRRMYVECYSKK